MLIPSKDIHCSQNEELFKEILINGLSYEQKKQINEKSSTIKNANDVYHHIQSYAVNYLIEILNSNVNAKELLAPDMFRQQFINDAIWRKTYHPIEKQLIQYMYQCYLPIVFDICIKKDELGFSYFLSTIEAPLEIFTSNTDESKRIFISLIIKELSNKVSLINTNSNFEMLDNILFQHLTYFKKNNIVNSIREYIENCEKELQHQHIKEFLSQGYKNEYKMVYDKPFEPIKHFSQFFVKDNLGNLNNIIDLQSKEVFSPINRLSDYEVEYELLFGNEDLVSVRTAFKSSKYLLSVLSDTVFNFSKNVDDSLILTSFINEEYLENFNTLYVWLNDGAKDIDFKTFFMIKRAAKHLYGKIQNFKIRYDDAIKMFFQAIFYKYMRTSFIQYMEDFKKNIKPLTIDKSYVFISKQQLNDYIRDIKKFVKSRFDEFFVLLYIDKQNSNFHGMSFDYRMKCLLMSVDVFLRSGYSPILSNNIDVVEFNKKMRLDTSLYKNLKEYFNYSKCEKLSYKNSGDLTTYDFLRECYNYFIQIEDICGYIMMLKRMRKGEECEIVDIIKTRKNMNSAREKAITSHCMNYMTYLNIFYVNTQFEMSKIPNFDVISPYSKMWCRRIHDKDKLKEKEKTDVVFGDRYYFFIEINSKAGIYRNISGYFHFNEEKKYWRFNFAPIAMERGNLLVWNRLSKQEMCLFINNYVITTFELMTKNEYEISLIHRNLNRRLISLFKHAYKDYDVVVLGKFFGCNAHLINGKFQLFNDIFQWILRNSKLGINDEQTSKIFIEKSTQNEHSQHIKQRYFKKMKYSDELATICKKVDVEQNFFKRCLLYVELAFSTMRLNKEIFDYQNGSSFSNFIFYQFRYFKLLLRQIVGKSQAVINNIKEKFLKKAA